jgi:hypothetical protein
MVKPFKKESLNLQTFHTLMQLDMNMTLNIPALRYKNMMHKNMVLKNYIEKNHFVLIERFLLQMVYNMQ